MRLVTIGLALLAACPVMADPIGGPALIGHRGLLRDAPENTLASFDACIALGIGFELDVRRTKDGALVVLHDETVDRTTHGTGKVADLTVAELKKLDAGRWFDPAFAGQRVPTLKEVFALLRERKANVLVAVDLKTDDPTYEADIVGLANDYKVLSRLVFIGRAIDQPGVRKELRRADRTTQVGALAQTAKDLDSALADTESDWVYARFVLSADEAERVRKAGKKLFLSGPPVNRHNPENFRKAFQIRADVILTDFPLECRRVWREGKFRPDR